MSAYEHQTDERLHELAGIASHTSEAQLRHRMALVEFWATHPGDRVLEVGCGQGDTTVVLADAVVHLPEHHPERALLRALERVRRPAVREAVVAHHDDVARLVPVDREAVPVVPVSE